MLKSLSLRAVGPAPQMTNALAERLNVITGDSGLGKSLLLDVAWWALTRTWAGTPALANDPSRGVIEYLIAGRNGGAEPVISRYRAEAQEWLLDGRKQTSMPGVVIYMRVDGGFSVWDPIRNYWREDRSDRPSAYHFNNREVWDGLRVNDISVSEGLERDWVSWQKGREPQFELLERVLLKLSPPDVPLKPGPPKRFDRPTLIVGETVVPVTIASARDSADSRARVPAGVGVARASARGGVARE